MNVVPVDRDTAGAVAALLDGWAAACRPRGLAEALPLVDEAEASRLASRAEDGQVTPPWRASVAVAASDGRTVGYASAIGGVGSRSAASGDSVGDQVGDLVGDLSAELVVDRFDARAAEAGDRLLGWLTAQTDGRISVWLRQVDDGLASIMAAHGASVERTLGIMARDVGGAHSDGPVEEPRAEPGGDRGDRRTGSAITIRASRGSATDVAGIVEVLAAAYAGTAEEGWDRERFERHAAATWFRHGDVLVAVEPDARGGERIVGVHWTKRRSATTGEVYNLAVAPEASGAGVGRRLLRTGLAHLGSVGCRQVVLWVDLANEAAVALYEQAGFAAATTDVSYRIGG